MKTFLLFKWKEFRVKSQELSKKTSVNYLDSSVLRLDSTLGFTLVEMTVVVGILTVLLSLAVTNLVSFQRSTNIQGARATLVADLYGQRLRAMTGDSQGQSTATAYGVYIEPHQYTLFRGASYTASASGNRVVLVEDPLQLSASFANSTIVFERGSGEIASYDEDQDTITVSTTDAGESIVIELNELGVVTQGAP